MKWAVVGLDGAKTEGGAVALDQDRRVIAVANWGPKGTLQEQSSLSATVHRKCIAKRVGKTALCYEEPVLWNNRNKPMWTVLRSISMAVGVWVCRFPEHSVAVNATTWRKAFGIRSGKGREDLKISALAIARMLVPANHRDQIAAEDPEALALQRAIDERDANMAEAYLIALFAYDKMKLGGRSAEYQFDPFKCLKPKTYKRRKKNATRKKS